MNQVPSAAANITKKVERLLSIDIVIIILTSLIVVIATLISMQKIKTYRTLQQEIQTIKQSQSNTNELLTYVDQNRDIINQIQTVFPNESNIDVAYQNILKIAQVVDSNAQLRIKANIPGLYNQKSILPMEMVLSTNTSGTLQVLRRMERLPYIVEIITLELANPFTEDGSTVINFRLYVDDEFSKL